MQKSLGKMYLYMKSENNEISMNMPKIMKFKRKLILKNSFSIYSLYKVIGLITFLLKYSVCFEHTHHITLISVPHVSHLPPWYTCECKHGLQYQLLTCQWRSFALLWGWMQPQCVHIRHFLCAFVCWCTHRLIAVRLWWMIWHQTQTCRALWCWDLDSCGRAQEWATWLTQWFGFQLLRNLPHWFPQWLC